MSQPSFVLIYDLFSTVGKQTAITHVESETERSIVSKWKNRFCA